MPVRVGIKSIREKKKSWHVRLKVLRMLYKRGKQCNNNDDVRDNDNYSMVAGEVEARWMGGRVCCGR